MKKLILDAKTAEDVEETRKPRVRVSIPDEHKQGEFVTSEVPLLSTEVRAMINNMLFLACYGHKVMFEDRVPQSSILAFRSCAWKNARENESNFYYLWKQYLARSGGVKDIWEFAPKRYPKISFHIPRYPKISLNSNK
jgi:hypothetical protein